MAQESFAKTVLAALTKLSATAPLGQVELGDISNALMVQTTVAHKRVANALRELRKQGLVMRVRQGVYALAKSTGHQELREVMWRLLRMRRRVTVDDLMEMSGAGVEYARDWLRMLENLGVVKKISQGAASNPRVWQLIKDTVEMPVDAENAARLRELRKKKKQQALADIAAAQLILCKAHQAITEMED